MRKSIMISGPHGIGKTTTAQDLSKHLHYMFIGSVASTVAKRLKFDINTNFDPINISKYQYEILKGMEFIYDATALVDTISDRSPLDAAVYLTLAIEFEDGFDTVIDEYRNLCIEMINKTCNFLVLPEADLDAAYENKFGRPTSTPEQVAYRKRYVRELDDLVSRISPNIKVIRVPVDKQYAERTSYILEELKNT